jgi:hypothetical protein
MRRGASGVVKGEGCIWQRWKRNHMGTMPAIIIGASAGDSDVRHVFAGYTKDK